MPSFFCRLVPPRASFVRDMTSSEAAVMAEHVRYWHELIETGTRVYALGVVMDPASAFGVGIVEVENDTAVAALTDDDPAIRANIGMRYEILAMPRGVLRAKW
jgi:YCII-related domain